MSRSRRLLPLLALGAALATAPAAAARSYELHARARGAHGFAVTLRYATVTDFGGQPVFFDAGSVLVSRRVQGQTLSRRLQAGKPARITATRRLGRARVRLAFGSRGRLSLRFAPTGRPRTMGADNCGEADLRGRRGVFRGTFRVRMGGVFATLRRLHLRGTLAADPVGDDCSDPDPIGGDDHLAFDAGGTDGVFYSRREGTVTRERSGRGWIQDDEIRVRGAGVFADQVTGPFDGPFTVSAQVRADGPFLTGSLDYGPVSGVPAENEYEGFNDVAGPVTGALTARFDRLGGAAATLSPTTGAMTRECNQCI